MLTIFVADHIILSICYLLLRLSPQVQIHNILPQRLIVPEQVYPEFNRRKGLPILALQYYCAYSRHSAFTLYLFIQGSFSKATKEPYPYDIWSTMNEANR